MNRTIAKGGKVHFNLDDVNVPYALLGDPDMFVNRYTAYELQQIVRNDSWFNSTSFYRGGQKLSPAQVRCLGTKLRYE